MLQLEINNQFGFVVPRKKNGFQAKKENKFESIVPSQTNVQEYRDSGYFLDSISEFSKNQSLTAEQIAESRAKAVNDEI